MPKSFIATIAITNVDSDATAFQMIRLLETLLREGEKSLKEKFYGVTEENSPQYTIQKVEEK